MYFESNCPKNSKNGIKILVGQAVFKLWIKLSKYCFLEMHMLFFSKGVDYEIEFKTS